jgi:hypothetical protein
MHGLISYLLWDTLFIPVLIIPVLAFLSDQDGCLRSRGVDFEVLWLPCHRRPRLRGALGVDG